MNPSRSWKKMPSKCLSNLWVLFVNNEAVGMIYKPKDNKTDKNAWRLYRGVGQNSDFLFHAWSKTDAVKLMEEMFVTGARR